MYYHLSIKKPNSLKIWLFCYISIQKSSSEGYSYCPFKTARWNKNYPLSGTNTYNKYFRICLSYDWVIRRHWTGNKWSEDQQVSRIFHSFRKLHFCPWGATNFKACARRLSPLKAWRIFIVLYIYLLWHGTWVYTEFCQSELLDVSELYRKATRSCDWYSRSNSYDKPGNWRPRI